MPHLATSVETPDPTTYIVKLRTDVRFHDGSPLTADDVAYTFGSFLDPIVRQRTQGRVSRARRRRRRRSAHRALPLKEPFGSFPIQLVMGIVQARVEEPVDAADRHRPVHLRPLRSRRPRRPQAVRRLLRRPARNPGLVLKVVPDDTMRGLELRKGTIDINVNDLAPDVVHELERSGDVKLTTAPGIDYAYVGLNMRDPLLRTCACVRRSRMPSTGRRSSIHLRRGLALPAVGLLPPMSWALDKGMPDFAYDPAKAKRLLDEAGYRDPDGDGPQPRCG